MLYALRHPVDFAVLLAAFVVGSVLGGVAEVAAGRLLGDRKATAYGRGWPDPRRHLDPFGAVAAAIAGVGWGRQPELPWPPGRVDQVALRLLAGPLTCLAAGLGLIAADGARGDPWVAGPPALVDILHANIALPLLLLAGTMLLAIGVLALVPLPPLPGGRLLFALAPRSYGWQRAEFELVEHNWGLVAVLVLLIFPFSGQSLLLTLLDLATHPLTVLVGTLR